MRQGLRCPQVLRNGAGCELMVGVAQVPHDAICHCAVGFGGPVLCYCVSPLSLMKSWKQMDIGHHSYRNCREAKRC